MAGANLTDQQILEYWKNPLYSFAFRCAKNFSLLLKTDLGIDVPASRLNRILQREPIFLIHQRRHKKILRRNFYLTTIGQTVQAGMNKLLRNLIKVQFCIEDKSRHQDLNSQPLCRKPFALPLCYSDA